MRHEIEVKVRVADADDTARRLEALGAALVMPRRFEDNRLFDLPDGALARSGRLLRLRECGDRTVLTGKGPADHRGDSPYKIRVEGETDVADPAGLLAALAAAGLECRWRYQKWRREYRLGGAMIVVDEIPHGTWIEIEGAPETIEEVATRLGIEATSFETATYREIHERACAAAGLPVGDMVFPGRGRTA